MLHESSMAVIHPWCCCPFCKLPLALVEGHVSCWGAVTQIYAHQLRPCAHSSCPGQALCLFSHAGVSVQLTWGEMGDPRGALNAFL